VSVIVIFYVWWSVVFAGDFEKSECLVWCFCGVLVVDCVANVVLLHHISSYGKYAKFLKFFPCLIYFGGWM
jgi:hypothetical protein